MRQCFFLACVLLLPVALEAQDDPLAPWREQLGRYAGANEEQRAFILADLRFQGETARAAIGNWFAQAADAALSALARGEALAAECRERYPVLRRRIRDCLERMPAGAARDATTGPGRDLAEAARELDLLAEHAGDWAVAHAAALGPDARWLSPAVEVLDQLGDDGAAASRLREIRVRVAAALPPESVGEHRSVTRFAEENRVIRQENETRGAALPEAVREIVARTNAYRASMGLRALALDERLTETARKHSEEMARLDYFSHRSPVRGRHDVADRIAAEGVRTTIVGENIARGDFSPAQILDAWRESPGHHRNLIDARFRHIGAGREGKAWTAVYAGEFR